MVFWIIGLGLADERDITVKRVPRLPPPPPPPAAACCLRLGRACCLA